MARKGVINKVCTGLINKVCWYHLLSACARRASAPRIGAFKKLRWTKESVDYQRGTALEITAHAHALAGLRGRPALVALRSSAELVAIPLRRLVLGPSPALDPHNRLNLRGQRAFYDNGQGRMQWTLE